MASFQLELHHVSGNLETIAIAETPPAFAKPWDHNNGAAFPMGFHYECARHVNLTQLDGYSTFKIDGLFKGVETQRGSSYMAVKPA